jgi:hypothetical protein
VILKHLPVSGEISADVNEKSELLKNSIAMIRRMIRAHEQNLKKS